MRLDGSLDGQSLDEETTTSIPHRSLDPRFPWTLLERGRKSNDETWTGLILDPERILIPLDHCGVMRVLGGLRIVLPCGFVSSKPSSLSEMHSRLAETEWLKLGPVRPNDPGRVL